MVGSFYFNLDAAALIPEAIVVYYKNQFIGGSFDEVLPIPFLHLVDPVGAVCLSFDETGQRKWA